MDRHIGVSRPADYKGKPLFRTSWALLLGVNTYKQSIPNLRFAEADASAFAKLLPEIGIPSENIRTLLGPAVSRGAIEDTIYELGSHMHQEDRLIVFFAGHSVPVQNAQRKNGYLLLPESEVSGAFPSPQSPYLQAPPAWHGDGNGPTLRNPRPASSQAQTHSPRYLLQRLPENPPRLA